MAKFIAVRVDNENNAEQWWDAVREQYPEFAKSLQKNDGAVIHPDAWNKLAALPGFADGPEHAKSALIDCGSEGPQWGDVVSGTHAVFNHDLHPLMSEGEMDDLTDEALRSVLRSQAESN